MKKATLIWKPTGYQVDFCKWRDYEPYLNGSMLAHDLFTHRPWDKGKVTDEIRACGATLRFGRLLTYKERGFIFTPEFVYEKEFKKSNPRDNTFRTYKDRKAIPRLAKKFAQAGWGTEKSCTKLLREGYDHAKQFTWEAYRKVCRTNFRPYQQRKVNLEISMVTGKILREKN